MVPTSISTACGQFFAFTGETTEQFFCCTSETWRLFTTFTTKPPPTQNSGSIATPGSRNRSFSRGILAIVLRTKMPVFVPIRVAGNTTLTTLADSRQTSISCNVVIRVELTSKDRALTTVTCSSILNRRDLSDQTVSGRTTVPISTVLSPIEARDQSEQRLLRRDDSATSSDCLGPSTYRQRRY